ncbi:ABC transporter permease [Nesterenkonia alba]|uniref:ABC transporter permease n=1 Tax=Nesterenkonia alba TaxID=515814 RepID=UPI0003B5093C|nr:ABC transporter permease [Nesterenkonia alba]
MTHSTTTPHSARPDITVGSLNRIDKTRSRRSKFLRRFAAHKLAFTGGSILVIVTLVAIFGPMLTPSPFDVAGANRLQPPSLEHPFGTDNYGRDVLARVAEGARVSLFVGAFTAVCTAVLGCAVGLYAAYNRVADMILMRISDGLMAFPAILLAIAIMAALGQQTSNVIIALTIVFTPYVARIVRSSALVVREQTFVEALKAQGASRTRIIWINIAPNVVSPLIVQATFVFADSIITEAALSFLGAGVPPPAPSWGNMLLDGKNLIYTAWWMTVFPGVFIMSTILAINLLGDGLRDLLDPTYRSKTSGRKRKARKAARAAARQTAAHQSTASRPTTREGESS